MNQVKKLWISSFKFDRDDVILPFALSSEVVDKVNTRKPLSISASSNKFFFLLGTTLKTIVPGQY